ncbi:VOC family protein [Mangrovihabitans endophyticus]|uniref:Glyoxalase n=1 Tax=Mangrovihabitans endophyticus TaxID=1751298 RepID=A0A8J3FP96_9ACTN|nr:VOC family protein [Mangrovihabitans endophyticus]GGK88008.1 glyoxalase [Mangrovihabitans endophyticus]
MSVPARISLATLGVADVARSTEFYASLGWKLSPASVPAVVSFFHTAGGLLSLVKTDDVSTDAGIAPRRSTDFRGVMLAINVASPAEVDESLRAVVQAGAALVKAGGEADWGGYVGYFTDPDGHLWEITYNPGFPLDHDGVPRLP